LKRSAAFAEKSARSRVRIEVPIHAMEDALLMDLDGSDSLSDGTIGG
jgi:hypothetical protein